jgi:ribonuclease VapC
VLANADRLGAGAPTVVETAVVLRARAGDAGRIALDALLAVADIEVDPFDAGHWRVAESAYARFGKGRHPAALNLGDCFAYASARVAGRPLLCIGDDFPRTDLDLVHIR